jgi:hypothetical protein
MDIVLTVLRFLPYLIFRDAVLNVTMKGGKVYDAHDRHRSSACLLICRLETVFGFMEIEGILRKVTEI